MDEPGALEAPKPVFDLPLLGRVVRPADYVRVLGTPLRLRSVHFAVHHLPDAPLPLKRVAPPAPRPDMNAAPVTASLSPELSTASLELGICRVDDSGAPAISGREGEPADGAPLPVAGGVARRWLGLVVPKRHAKRAVTRTLVKRQIRTIAASCAAALEPGIWVVRQRQPFDPKQFPSAASDALKTAVRDELRALFERAVRGERDRVKPRPAARGKAA